MRGFKIAELQSKIDVYWSQVEGKFAEGERDYNIWNTKTDDIMYMKKKGGERLTIKYDPKYVQPEPKEEEKPKGKEGDKKDGDAKATDDKACDALADASDDAKAECKKWSGKKCADEKEEDKKKECEAAKASAKALVAGVIALLGVTALM